MNHLTQLTFHRLTRDTKNKNVTYTTTKVNDTDSDIRRLSSNMLGFNLHYEVFNYTQNDIILSGSRRSSPTVIPPTTHYSLLNNDFDDNTVVIKITHWNTLTDPRTRKPHSVGDKTIIRVDGKALNDSALFIEEIDLYLGTKFNHNVISRFIADDCLKQKWDSIDLLVDTDNIPHAKIYHDFKELSRIAVVRQDRLHMRVGKTKDGMDTRISILDDHFNPFKTNKLFYDPTLEPDEFVIETMIGSQDEEFRGTFKDLAQCGCMIIDPIEYVTFSGTFPSMAIFHNEEVLIEYTHRRKSERRFEDENRYLANHGGDLKLKQEIRELQTIITRFEEKTKSLEDEANHLKRINKELADANRHLERDIKDLKEGTTAKLAAENIAKSIENEAMKLMVEHEELRVKEKTFKSSHKATMVKNRAETIKNVATIISVTIATITALYTGYKKLKALTS